MIISKCEFYPPYREGAVVDVNVVINGIAVLIAALAVGIPLGMLMF